MMHDDRIKTKLQLKLNLQRPAAREIVDERCQLLVSSISQERIEYLSPTPRKGLWQVGGGLWSPKGTRLDFSGTPKVSPGNYARSFARGSEPMPATSRRCRPREYQPDAGFRVRRKNMPYSLVTAEITIPPQVMDFILSRVTKILRLSGREVMLFRELRSLWSHSGPWLLVKVFVAKMELGGVEGRR